MSESSIILEIPVEILHTVFRVEKEDPLKPIMDIILTKKIDSSSQSVHRLMALSKLSSSASKVSDYPTPIIRDLWRGKYWTMKEKGLSLAEDLTGHIHRLEPIQRLDVGEMEGKVKDIAAPFQGWLARGSDIPFKEILSHVRLEDLESRSEIVYLRTKVSQKEDRAGRKFWIYEEGPLKQLVGKHIDKLPGFEMDEREVIEDVNEWPYSPEVIALQTLRTKIKLSGIANAKSRKDSNNSKLKKVAAATQTAVIKEAGAILESITSRLEEDKRPRLEQVKHVVGFRQDMWDAAQEVIKSAERKAFVLTSFSNPQFSSEVIELLAEASRGDGPEILLSFGEPDRGRSLGDIENTKQYISTLSRNVRLKFKGGISPAPTHSKIIVSDTGMVFICSCNLFSGSLQSGVLESGILIKDAECAKAIIKLVGEERWVPENISREFSLCAERIENLKPDNYFPDTKSKISEIKADIRKSQYWYAIPKLERMLLEIAEKPIWSLIRTLQHRPFMTDCIERFEERLVMASDGLRSNGLDKASIAKIGNCASENKATVQIWWGRHAPNSEAFDEVDKRGRKEAKSRLTELRGLANSKSGDRKNRWSFFPKQSNEPMETHAKMFIVDELRLMVTSDNTLSFGDTEAEKGDAGELGIVIDHPRLAIQTTGCMESWLPDEALIPGNKVRWWALLGEEVSMQTEDPFQKIPLINALDSLIERIESSAFLKSRWEREIESDSNEIEILNKLVLGSKFGMYSIAESSKSSGTKSRLSENQIGEAVISLAKKNRWKVPIDDLIDNALISALSQYKSKSGKRPHFILQGGRSYEIFYESKSLHMQFDEDFVLPYLVKHEEGIISELNSIFNFEVEVSWSLTDKGQLKHDISTEFQIEGEITPKIWSNSLILFMEKPNKFEFISIPYNLMVGAEPKLKLGKGELAKFVDEECSEFIEWKKKKGQLYVRRRKE